MFAVSSKWASMLLEVVPPNSVLCCWLTILEIVESGRWNRGRNAVDICRLCKETMNARLAIGFAAERVPFGIAATIERTFNGDWGSSRGIIFDENDAGRSRRHSGTSTLVCFIISTGDMEGCGICRSSFLPRLEGGVVCTLCPKTRNGAAIAFDIEGHISEVAAAIPGNAECWKAMVLNESRPRHTSHAPQTGPLSRHPYDGEICCNVRNVWK